jgi:hypothetical protein
MIKIASKKLLFFVIVKMLKLNMRVMFSMLAMGVSMAVMGFTMYAKHISWDIPGLNIISILGKGIEYQKYWFYFWPKFSQIIFF